MKYKDTGRRPLPQTATQLPLPGVDVVPKTPGDTSPLNNYIARTPLFSPIKRGRRAMLDKKELPSPEGMRVQYSGKQLDMTDQDVFLFALRVAAGRRPDERITLNRAEFFRVMGWRSTPGKAAYKWLADAFDRLASGRVYIDTASVSASIPLIGPLRLDKVTGEYTFTVPSETLELFARQAFAYIDLSARRALTRQVDLSKWLQGYIGSNAQGSQWASVENLMRWSGYQGRVRDFRTALGNALDELKRVGIVSTWAFKDRMKIVSWIR